MKTVEELKAKLNEYGTLVVFKEGDLFIVLIIASGGLTLNKWPLISEIKRHILEYVVGKYTKIEVFNNDAGHFLYILKP